MLPQESTVIQSFTTGLYCFYCYKPLIDPRTPEGTEPYYIRLQTGAWRLNHRYGVLTYDHLLPRAAGGNNAAYNRVPACQGCNCAKADGAFDPFYEATATERAIRQIEAALDVLKSVVGTQFVGPDKLITGREYNIAKRVLRRASHKIRSEAAREVHHAQ